MSNQEFRITLLVLALIASSGVAIASERYAARTSHDAVMIRLGLHLQKRLHQIIRDESGALRSESLARSKQILMEAQ